MAGQTLTFEQHLHVTPELALRAFTNASLMRRWLSDVATTDPRPGGRLYLAWDSGYYAAGEYTAVEPGAVAFTWNGRGTPGVAQVHVAAETDGAGARLSLQHLLPDDSPAWQSARQQAEDGWRESLENLVSVLEHGLDLRFVNRPMLGVFFGSYSADAARQLGGPEHGVILENLVEGMGAEAAGLRVGDVVVQLGDTPMLSVGDFTRALVGKRAGDTLPVLYYRDGERRALQMTLSRRPLRDTPWEPTEFARILRGRFDEILGEMDAFFTGVREEQADYRPAPGAWTVKEILAHLLQGERFMHFYIDEVLGGYENWSDGWGGNQDAHVRATVAAYPTLPDLLAEIRRGFAETVAFYANLPADFVATNKAGYWWLVYGEMEAPYHFRAHLDQMSHTLAAAREAGV